MRALINKIFSFISRHSTIWALVYFTLATLVMTYPLVLHITDSMVGQVGDNIYFVWMIGWVKRALFDLHVNPFDIWFLNYPEGWSLAHTEITPAMLLIAMPFCLLGGPTLGYNAAMLMTFILSGFGMYLWVERMTGRKGAALIAGTMFAFGPYHFAHFLIGHLNLSGTQWFPFYFMGFFEIMGLLRPGEEDGRFRWRPVLTAGISLGLIAMTSQYYFIMTLLVSAFLLFCYLIFMERSKIRSGIFWKKLVMMGVVALPLALVAVAPFISLASQGGIPDRELGVVRQLANGSPTDFILPSTDHFLWGAWVGDNFNREMWIENTLYIGAVSGILALLAWIVRRRHAHRRIVALMLAGGAFAFILALGIDLHWLEEPVRFSPPEFLRGFIFHGTSYPVILPGYFLFKYLPFYAKLRTFMRFGVFVLTFTCAAAGIGTAWLIKKISPRWQVAGIILILGLVYFDFYPGTYTQFARVKARPVDTWLAQQPGDGAVIQFPFIQSEDQDQVYYTLIHQKPFVGGFFNAFPPVQYTKIKPQMERFPDQESVALIRDLGVEFVLVDQTQYKDIEKVRSDCEALGLRFVTQIKNELVFSPQ